MVNFQKVCTFAEESYHIVPAPCPTIDQQPGTYQQLETSAHQYTSGPPSGISVSPFPVLSIILSIATEAPSPDGATCVSLSTVSNSLLVLTEYSQVRLNLPLHGRQRTMLYAGAQVLLLHAEHDEDVREETLSELGQKGEEWWR